MLKRKRSSLSNIPTVPCPVDDLKGIPFKPTTPLPAKSFVMYIVGCPGSGKSNLWQAMMTSKEPIYYRSFFDRVEVISSSLGTLAPKILKQLPENQFHNEYTDTLLSELVKEMKSSPGMNGNNLLILDDVVNDLNKSKILCKVFLNRRHCTHNPHRAGRGGLSIMVTSQKYNLLKLMYRNACDHVILFKTTNNGELRFIRDELMQDLNTEQQEKILGIAWAERYSFLFVKMNEPTERRYYAKFDLIVV